MRKHESLYARIIANTHEPSTDDGCWLWKGERSSNGYPRINLRVPGVGHVKLQAHIALWVWMEAEPENVEEFYLAYQEFKSLGPGVGPCVRHAGVRALREPGHQERERVAEA